MISVFLFFSSLFFFSKSFFIFSEFLYVELETVFILMIFSLVFYCIFMCLHNSPSEENTLIYKMIFFFFFFFLFFCFSFSGTFFFLLSLELCSFIMMFFIFNYAKDSDKISSSFFMFLINMLGSIPFMIFCLECPLMFNLEGLCFSFSSYTMMIFFSLILACKVPIFILHFWLTKAHVSASGSGSIILASIMLKIGSVGLMKWGPFFSFLFNKISIMFLSSFLILGGFVLLVMNRFFDLKFLVACSSVIHMALTMPFFLFSSVDSFYSSILMMVGHGITSCMLFFLVTLLYEVSMDRSIFSSKSIESFSLTLIMIIVVWMILNLGFPPFPSFISELFFMFFLFSLSSFFSIAFFFILLLAGLTFINSLVLLIFFKKNILVSSGSSYFWVSSFSLVTLVPFFMLCLVFS